MIERFINIFENSFSKDEIESKHFVFYWSAGKDSSLLLGLLLEMRKKYNFILEIVTVAYPDSIYDLINTQQNI